MIEYHPLIKGKGFCPNPVARYGIPPYADSASFSKVLGTVAHEDWWNEQIDRCINGYTTGGIWIPGRYYYYLNFIKISTLGRGNHFPDYIDLDLEFFLLVEEAKRDHKGIISLKGRRRGLSEKVAKGVASYGFRFYPEGYRFGVAAGLEDYAAGFFNKFKSNNNLLPPEFRLHELKHDEEEVKAGWKERTGVGIQNAGSENTAWCRTMFTSANVFKGELLDDCVFEEAGEFKFLNKGYSATKACFAVGPKMVGTPFVYGTGGKITSATKEFQDMWYDAGSYYLLKMPVFGQRMLISYFVGSKNEQGVLEENCPNIFQMQKEMNLDYEQILGCEDVVAADEKILETRRFLSQAKNKELYYEYFLDNPRNEKDAFLKFSGNNFDTEALANQRFRIDAAQIPPIKAYLLDWERDADGKLLQPLQVRVTIADDHQIKTREEDIVLMRYTPELIKNYKNAATAGIDSYDQDVARASKSLGAMVVTLRKGHPYTTTETYMDGGIAKTKDISKKRIPVVLIRTRPHRKEVFYDNSLKVAVLWNLIGNCMIDAAKPGIIQYFKDNLGERYLALRPQSMESADSQQTHQYGMLMTSNGRSKPTMLAMVQTWVLDESDECWFSQIIDGCSEYDIEQKDSDWDEVDALGLALVRDVDMKQSIRKKDDQQKEDPYALPVWVERNGEMIDIGHLSNEEDVKDIKDPFLRRIEQGYYG
jgi:hypothetical protein